MMFLPRSQAPDDCGQNGGPVSTRPQPGSGSPKVPAAVGREEGRLPTASLASPASIDEYAVVC